MHKYTVDRVMAAGPCSAYSEDAVRSRIGEGKTAQEIAELPIPVEDRIWVLLSCGGDHVAAAVARIVTRAVTQQALPHPATSGWAKLWLSRRCKTGPADEFATEWGVARAVESAKHAAARAHASRARAAGAAAMAALNEAQARWASAAILSAVAADFHEHERRRQLRDILDVIEANQLTEPAQWRGN